MKSEELYREERLIRRARAIVDRTLSEISHKGLYGREAWSLYRDAREKVLAMFPDKKDAFKLIYWPRFSRVIWENMLRELDLASVEDISF